MKGESTTSSHQNECDPKVPNRRLVVQLNPLLDRSVERRLAEAEYSLQRSVVAWRNGSPACRHQYVRVLA